MTHSVNTNPTPSRQPDSNVWLNAAVEVFSGGTGGAAGITAAAPFMYLKMYMQQKAQNPQNPPAFQKNPIKWFVGSPTMAAGMFPVTAFQFAVNGFLREKLSNNGEHELTPTQKLACSIASGGIVGGFRLSPRADLDTAAKAGAA